MAYQVSALVIVPYPMSYRYFGSDEFILNSHTFIQDTGTDAVMLYAFDVAEGTDSETEDFLSDYTSQVNIQYDYESKATYRNEFASFRSMLLVLGGALSFIVGLVGIVNFLNATLAGILTRKREFAVLQSNGMTGRQLKGMLVYEGLFYALGSILIALILAYAASPLLASMLEQFFGFFSYHFTIAPILLTAPIFVALGCLVPLVVYRVVAKATIVERLREAGSCIFTELEGFSCSVSPLTLFPHYDKMNTL